MNKEIKVIDLLNMIAEGKEVPKRIKYNEIVYSYCDLDTSYNNEEYTRDLFSVYDIPSILNDTVEIIEEDNNKIEKDLHPYGSCSDEDLYNGLVNKLYKVIDYINEKWGMYE